MTAVALGTPTSTGSPSVHRRLRPASSGRSPLRAPGEIAAAGHSAQRPRPSGLTLEDTILGVWEDLTAGRAECPACSGDLRPGGCLDCGSHLS